MAQEEHVNPKSVFGFQTDIMVKWSSSYQHMMLLIVQTPIFETHFAKSISWVFYEVDICSSVPNWQGSLLNVFF